MEFTFTPEELEVADYSHIDPRRYGEQTVGAGKKGVKKNDANAIQNAIQHNAIQAILKRGYGKGNPNKWDEGDISGPVAKASGVTVQQIEDAERSRDLPLLEKEYNSTLKALGVKNKDGSARQVQWGDTAADIQVIIKNHQEKKNLDKTEPSRIRTAKAIENRRVDSANKGIEARNRAGTLQEQKFNYEVKEGEKNREEAKTIRRENNERQDRRDALVDKRYYEDKAARREEAALIRAEGAADRAASMKMKIYEIDANNQYRQEEAQYRRELDQRNKNASIVASLASLAGLFAV